MNQNSLFDNQRLSSLLEAVDAAIVTIDNHGIIIDANSATKKLFGHDEGWLVGKNVKVLMPGPYRQEHDGYLENHRTTGKAKIIGSGRRVEGLHESGRVFPIHLSVAQFKEEGKDYYTGIIHDLTELNRAEASSLKLERLIDECINEVCTIDADSLLLTSANREVLKNLGYSPHELHKLTLLDIMVSVRSDELTESMDALRRGDEQLISFSPTLLRKNGSTYEAEVQMYYLDELEQPEFATIAMDVTDRNRMMQSLRQSQRMESIGNLSGGIAHDFNNILSVILGNAELMQMQQRSQDDSELLVEINEAAKMGSRLTSRLLAFARRKPLAPETTDMNTVIKALTDMLGRLLDTPITLVLALTEKPALVNVDVSEVENALVNLVVNAKDAMPNGGKVAIETEHVKVDVHHQDQINLKAGSYVRLSISDTGGGVDESIADRIFEPFVSTKEESHGTGLGLSMVYGFVKQSGGTINCYSEISKGTTFTIYLPSVNQNLLTSEPLETASSVTSKGYKKILIAEDDELVRKLTVRRLEILGYEVLVASNGYEALELFKQCPDVDLVFSDVVMTEGMTGYDLAVEIQALSPNTPILLTSGYAENVLNAEQLEKSGLALLRKPYEQNELMAALDRAFK